MQVPLVIQEVLYLSSTGERLVQWSETEIWYYGSNNVGLKIAQMKGVKLTLNVRDLQKAQLLEDDFKKVTRWVEKLCKRYTLEYFIFAGMIDPADLKKSQVNDLRPYLCRLESQTPEAIEARQSKKALKAASHQLAASSPEGEKITITQMPSQAYRSPRRSTRKNSETIAQLSSATLDNDFSEAG